jgi:hypothetical protein
VIPGWATTWCSHRSKRRAEGRGFGGLLLERGWRDKGIRDEKGSAKNERNAPDQLAW